MNKKFVWALIGMLSWLSVSWAAPRVTTSVNSQTIGLDEVLTVTYQATDLSTVVDQELPEIRDFIQVGISQSSSSNGEYSITIHLQATKTGKFTIPGIKLYLKSGQSLKSESVQVEVVQSKGNSAKRQQRGSGRGSPMDVFDQMDKEISLMQLYSELNMINTYLSFGNLSTKEEKKLKARKIQLEKEIKKIKNQEEDDQPFHFDRDDWDQNVQPQEGFFIKAIPSKTTAYVGEPIMLTFKIFSSTSFSNGEILGLPSLDDFTSMDYEIESNPRAKIETYNGKRYQTLEIRKSVIFPAKEGVLNIEPFEISAATEAFGKVKVKSEPVSIYSKKLPKVERQTAFTGALGNFSISTSINKTKMSTDDVGSLTLTIGGKGNFDIFGAPIPKDLSPHITMSSPSVQIDKDKDNLLRGKKTFTFNFTVDEAGEYKIPAIPFTYFDIDREEFITLETEPITLSISQGELIHTDRELVEKKKGELMDIYSGKLAKASKGSGVWAHSFTYIAALILSLLLIPTFVHRKQIMSKTIATKEPSTNKVAMARLKQAKELLHHTDSSLFYEEVSKSIWLYLGERLDISMSRLNKAELSEKLQERHIEQGIIDQTIDIITTCEMALYASHQDKGQKEQLLDKSRDLIVHFEDKLKQAL